MTESLKILLYKFFLVILFFTALSPNLTIFRLFIKVNNKKKQKNILKYAENN